MNLTVKQLGDLEQKFTSLKASAKRVREEAQETVMTVVRSVEVGGTAFGLGIVNGRFQRPELLGVPADLLVAIGAHGLGFAMDKNVAPHCHNIGDGALCSYLSTMGIGIGTKMFQENAKP